VEANTFFLTLLLVLLSARVLGELAARFHTPPVIGELAAGILLGPSLLGWIEPGTTIKLLAEIGIILLLFEVGLETDITRLVRTGMRPVIVAVAGFVMPLASGYVVSHYLFGQSQLVSLFIGGTLTATSIGITVRILTDLKRQGSPEAQIVLGAAVLDDILGIVLLAFLYEFSVSGGMQYTGSLKILLFVTLFMVLAPVAAKLFAEIIKRFERASQIPGLIPTTVVALVLLFAWMAHVVGAPQLLGGFAAGLALSRRFFFPMGVAIATDPHFAHRMESQMKPIIHLFTPIFFVMVGLSLNLKAVDWSSPFIWTFSMALFVLAVAGKILSSFLIRETLHGRLAIGFAMVPRGEVGLIFAELGRSTGIFDHEVYAALIIVIAFTTLAPPFVMKWFYVRYAHRLPEHRTST